MADEILIFDAAASNIDGTDPGSPLSIGPGTSYPLIEASFPAPPLNVLYASSVDTEGEIPVSRRYGNRTINLRLAVDESSAVTTLFDALAVKFAKLQREGGTLKRTRKDGSVRIYDIVAGDGWDHPYDITYLLAHSTEVPISLPARPLARGTEQDLGDNVETTLPCLVFTEASVAGDVDGLGRLVIDEDQAVDQQWVTWGIQSRNYSSSANAALFYEAEGRTALAGSAIAAGPAGASGAGSNVMRNTTLATIDQAILSTQATGGGAHLSHIGTFRVFARVQAPTTNTGTVTLALDWGEGDFRRFTRNPSTSLNAAWEGTWRIVDLGLVSPTKTTAGTQRWEARVIARSTVSNDDIDVDWLMLVPADEGSAQVAGVSRINAPTVFVARDEFDQTAGALGTPKTLPIGGNWSETGGVAAFTVEAVSHTVRRTSGGGDGIRFARAGTGTWTDVVAQCDVAFIAGSINSHGVFARYTNTTNYLRLVLSSLNGFIQVFKVVAGVSTKLMEVANVRAQSEVTTLRLFAGATGEWAAYKNGVLAGSGQDADLATGGTLATGGAGLYDDLTFSDSPTSQFDNFAVWNPAKDAAVFASQSLEIRHDRVTREDSGGTIWQEPSSYIGDYLRIPPAGAEGRTLRVLVKASRSVPGGGADAGTDDLSARLFVTPRFLN